ncbi:uncharacterized protein F5Z01DRAFT_674821 [Emericellopsis atlantica]|uniref:2EXR domain-containing protein n=1 Tax=Emericellopsis atlantica TaxID=2614577 RepID=A0A9P7ZL06_9HYPO|nr:uncharacterized protein F5Z01DRAFT_674821 [Emericellopsis atlantica]KAG9253945.1 hypothetical protein F5Z01DRAFT_674821 [Emericellopsis atlantica]
MEVTSAHHDFHLFSQLPPEIRLRIWSLNLPQTSRLIPINANTPSSPSNSKQSSPSRGASGCTTTIPVPPNLHVCSESRLHALQTFTPSFGFARTQGRIPFDSSRDMVYFPRLPGLAASSSSFRSFLLLCCPDELSRLRRVAVHEDVLGVDDACYHSGIAVGRTMEIITLIRARLPSVDEVIFVSTREDSGRRLQMQVETAVRDQCEDTLRCMVVLEGAE